MAETKTPDVANVTMQEMINGGLNAFAVDLLVESYAKIATPPPITFVWRGVVVSLRAWSPPSPTPETET